MYIKRGETKNKEITKRINDEKLAYLFLRRKLLKNSFGKQFYSVLQFLDILTFILCWPRRKASVLLTKNNRHETKQKKTHLLYCIAALMKFSL